MEINFLNLTLTFYLLTKIHICQKQILNTCSPAGQYEKNSESFVYNSMYLFIHYILELIALLLIFFLIFFKLFKSSYFSFWFCSHMKQKHRDNYYFFIIKSFTAKIAFLFLLGYLCRIQSNKTLGYWHRDFLKLGLQLDNNLEEELTAILIFGILCGFYHTRIRWFWPWWKTWQILIAAAEVLFGVAWKETYQANFLFIWEFISCLSANRWLSRWQYIQTNVFIYFISAPVFLPKWFTREQ